MREAHRDDRLRARVTSSRALYYREGADPSLDRPAHVRAASGICHFAGRLAIVQDDAAFLCLLEADGSIAAVTLPAGPGGARTFDDERGNKPDKPDLESCFSLSTPAGDLLIALGSGSSPRRERVALLAERALDTGRLVDASGLYRVLREELPFAGSELNVEGAAALPSGEVLLFQRGNGAARDGLEPVNATARLDSAGLLRFLEGGPAPTLHDVEQWRIGALGGVRMTFTDATTLGDRVLFLACAEDSPDAVRDGPVLGSAVGVLDDDGGARWAPLEGEVGLKAEGLVMLDAHHGLVVGDPDDPHTPGTLCEVELSGPWF